MAVKSKSTLLSEIAANINDNTAGDVTPADVRTRMEDMVDSMFVERWEASFDGSGQVVTSGAASRKPVINTGTITKAAVTADVSGSVTVDVKKYTPSGGSLGDPTTLGSIALASAAHNSSTPSWAVTAGDVLEFSLSGTIASVKRVFVRVST